MGKEKVIVKVGVYLRKSRSDEGIQDLKKHQDYLVNICNRNEWLYELYEEIDSSQDINRAELQRLRHDITLGKIDAVMVHAVDRLSRRSRHFLEIIEDYFIAQGMTKLYVKDTEHNLLDNTTITMLQLQATLSQAEYSFIVARLRDGRRSSSKSGIWSGKLIYGYEFDKDKRKIVPIEDEFYVARKICDMVLEGYSYGAICDEVNRLGYRTRKGNEFNVHNIKSIVHSPFIRGHVIINWNDEQTIVKDNHEAVISDAEYEKMKQILERRSEQYTNVSVAPKHFLQGLLRCSSCGLVMVVQANKESSYKEGTRLYGDYRYYVRKCRNKECNNYGCNVTEAEDIIRKILEEYVEQIEERKRLLKEINKDVITQDYSTKSKELKRAIVKLEDREESLLELLLDKTISKDVYNKRIEKCKEDKSKFINELNSLQSFDVEQENKHMDNVKDLIDHYDDLSGESKRRLLQLTFAKIEYTRLDKTDTVKLDVYPN